MNYLDQWGNENKKGIDKFADDMAEPFKSKHRIRKAWNSFKYHCGEFSWYICMMIFVLFSAITFFIITLLLIHGH